MFKVLLITLIMLTLPHACKGKDEVSKAQGIENLTLGEGTHFQAGFCGLSQITQELGKTFSEDLQLDQRISYQGDGEDIDLDELKSVIYQSIAFLPPTMIDLLVSLDMEIVLSDGTPQQCSCDEEQSESELCKVSAFGQSFDNAEATPVLSCYKKAAGSSKLLVYLGSEEDQGRLEAYKDERKLNTDAVDGRTMVIRRDLVRTLSLVFSRHYRKTLDVLKKKAIEQSVEAPLRALFEERINAHSQLQQRVKSAFMADVMTSPILSDQAVDHIKAMETQSDAQEQGMFADFVLAEVLDSMYCHLAARQMIKDNFPKTFNTLGLIQENLATAL